MIILKLIISTFLFTIAFSANARKFRSPPIYTVKGEFYPTMSKSFYTFKRPLDEKVFHDLPQKRRLNTDAEIRKVKLADLGLGIKAGDTAYSIDILSERITKYVFKEYVSVLVYSHPEEDFTWGRYNVFLTDDEKEQKSLIQYVSSPFRSGFVYIGNDLDFSKAEFVKVPLEKAKSKEQVPKELLKNGRFDHLKISNYFKDTLIYEERTPMFWNPSKDVITGHLAAIFLDSKELDLHFVKLSNGMMLLPLGTDWWEGMRLMIIYEGNKYGQISVKEYQEWEPKAKR